MATSHMPLIYIIIYIDRWPHPHIGPFSGGEQFYETGFFFELVLAVYWFLFLALRRI